MTFIPMMSVHKLLITIVYDIQRTCHIFGTLVLLCQHQAIFFLLFTSVLPYNVLGMTVHFCDMNISLC